LSPAWQLQFGATVRESGVEFRVWAPRARRVELAVDTAGGQLAAMQPEGDGVFAAFAAGASAGADYRYILDGGRSFPDPVSRWQPHGVHGPSRVLDPAFAWSDANWRGMPLEQYVIYELHTGAFTPQGNFEAIVPRLGELREFGITAIELMPVAEFPGSRNWGYDGVDLYAPQSSYGGPAGLKTLVDACHHAGLAVVLDVVYNHLGPEGNYLGEFGPYFTDCYRTPWGDAINYDGRGSDGVRRFFVDNALYWLTEYHVDALRLDAIHGIFDFSARHILQEMAEAFHAQADKLGRFAWLIAESDLNDARVITPSSQGGYGVDAQWLDDFHHSLHTSLAADTHGYFADFDGLPSLRKAIVNGYVYEGQHSRFRGRRHGSSSKRRPGRCFVAFTQNHDQIANAMRGLRQAELLSLEQQKLAAAALFFAPFVPLLFMGQEYGETAPFLYFTDHGDPALIAAVGEGRRKEYEAFSGSEFTDPQDPSSFQRSKLNWNLRQAAPHSALLAWYRDWLRARKANAALANGRKSMVRAKCDAESRWLVVQRGDLSGSRALLVCNFAEEKRKIPIPFKAQWSLCLWSGAPAYGAPLGKPAPRISSGWRDTLEIAGTSAALYLALPRIAPAG